MVIAGVSQEEKSGMRKAQADVGRVRRTKAALPRRPVLREFARCCAARWPRCD
jgi:hypothetical protein